jgi:hypothetical protein
MILGIRHLKRHKKRRARVEHRLIQKLNKIAKNFSYFSRITNLFCTLNYCPRADGEGTNSPRLFTPGETKALAKSKVHQLSRAWVTNDGWSSSLISKIWPTVMNSGHWLVQFKVCIITTAWWQRNSKHFLLWWLINFLQIYFIFARILARFCKFQERKGERIC